MKNPRRLLAKLCWTLALPFIGIGAGLVYLAWRADPTL